MLDSFASDASRREEENLLLDVQREVEQAHHLRDPRARGADQCRERRLVLDGATADQASPVVRESDHAGDAGEPGPVRPCPPGWRGVDQTGVESRGGWASRPEELHTQFHTQGTRESRNP